MLHEFLSANRGELVKRCGAKVARRLSPAPTGAELEFGVARLITQLIELLRAEAKAAPDAPYAEVPVQVGVAAGKHGSELLHNGYTLNQVVHDYGDLCQALTELAEEKKAQITVGEFHTFNRCLDNAIAGAVSEFGRLREHSMIRAGAETMNERLVMLAGELRTCVNSAMLAFNAIKTGGVAAGGATGGVLDRSLTRLSDIIERTLTEARLQTGTVARPEMLVLDHFLEQLGVFAVLEATTRGVAFEIVCETGLQIDADPQLLSSAISILLQNALRFTPRGGRIVLRARRAGPRVLIAVEDGCGGLSPATTKKLFHVLENPDLASGTGVAIVRLSVQAAGGKLGLDSVAHVGCVFTIDIPSTAS
ncbi:MAG: HAMP domain-containing sensor histidine kinase [Kofleriaceae bacterium]